MQTRFLTPADYAASPASLPPPTAPAPSPRFLSAFFASLLLQQTTPTEAVPGRDQLDDTRKI